MDTFTTLRKGSWRITFAVAATALVCLGFSAQKADAALPGPDITSGPAIGQVLGTDTTAFDFEFLDPIVGGNLVGFLCSVDGAAAVSCSAPFNLANLTAGAHTFGVAAEIQLLGGVPLCILTICVDPGPISVFTDLTSRTFSVDLGDTHVGTPTTDGGGATTPPTHTSPGVGVSSQHKKQVQRCKKLKRKLNKHFTKRSNKLRVRKRYMRCLKTQRKLKAKVSVASTW